MADEPQNPMVTNQKISRILSKPGDFLSEKNYKFLLAAVFTFAVAIRLYYFFLTRDQALWWDEAEYISIAKQWVYGLDYSVNPQRMPVVPLLAAIILKVGGDINIVKILLSVVPSVGVVIATYAIGEKFYNKGVGLAASFIMSVFWVSLFWTNRINTDMLAFLFASLGIYFMWVGLITGEKPKHTYYFLPLLALSFLTKPNMMLVVASALIFLLAYFKLELLKKKEFIISGLLALPLIILFLVWEKLQFGTYFAFSGATYVLATTGAEQIVAKPIGWHVLNFVPIFTEKVFFWVFLLGLLLAFSYLAIGWDLIKTDRRQSASLFLLILMSVTLIYFVFVERDAEDRWVLPITLSVFLLVGAGLEYIWGRLKKINKNIALLTIAGLLVFGAYFELAHGESIIKMKIDSYRQVKDAALWMKEHSSPSDYLITWSEPQTLCYSERKQLSGFRNESDFEAKVKLYKPKYLTISSFERHSDWVYDYPQRHNASLMPVQIYFFDSERRQLALVIYEFRNYEL